MKIVHISDTHVMRTKYHDEYRAVFEQIYSAIEQEKPDCVVHTGDLFHSKLELTPEAVELAADFLKGLSKNQKLFILTGNHDKLGNNKTRLDSITPIVNAINSPNIHHLKNSQEFLFNNDVVFNSFAIYDEENWIYKPTHPEKINIALYHGSINGLVTDSGYALQHCDTNFDIFKEMDYGLFGDLHLENQIVDSVGKFRYAGSTIQQNFGENDNKGYLIWNIESKFKYSCEHRAISRPKPFISVFLDQNGDLIEENIKKNSKLRMVVEQNLPIDKIKKNLDILKAKYKPESTSYINKSTGSAAIEKEIIEKSQNENLRDIEVQEKLIRTYLQDFKLEESQIKSLLDINKKYNDQITASEDISRNIKWKIKKLEWDNLFNYSEGNSVDYEKLKGVIAVAGANASGKSSFLDALLYALFNTTSKGNRKNLNVINQNKEYGSAKVTLEIDGNEFVIERKSEKYLKKLNGKETLEAKTVVDFKSSSDVLTGLDRNDTDKNIRKYLGSIDDFLLTSFASQFGFLSFIEEGSTKRKEILAKFLDLEIFDKKFKLAKEESAEIKSVLKKLENSLSVDDIKTTKKTIEEYSKLISDNEANIITLEARISEEKDKLRDLEAKIASIPKNVTDSEQINNTLKEKITKLASIKSQNEEYNRKLIASKELIEKINDFLVEVNIEDLKNKQKQLDEKKKDLLLINKDIINYETLFNTEKKKLKILDEVPCGDQFSHCKFIKDAYASKTSIVTTQNNLNKLNFTKEELETSISEIETEEISDLISKFHQVTKKQTITSQNIKDYNNNINKNNELIAELTTQIDSLELKIKEFEQFKEIKEKLHEYVSQKTLVSNLIVNLSKEFKNKQSYILDLHKKHAAAEEKLRILENNQLELAQYRQKYSDYDLFMQCMHPSGISYDITKNKLPIINAEIAKILTNITNFNVTIVNDDNKLDLMIKYPKYESRPLEMGSGAEKTIASMAIRLALTNITTLPHCLTAIWLDEPATSLDKENLEAFTKVLDMFKESYDVIFVISHLDTFKEYSDNQIIIDKKNGYAHISC